MRSATNNPYDGIDDGNEQTGLGGHMRTVPVLPVRETVVFPKITVPVMVSATSSTLIEDAMKSDRIIGMLAVKDPGVEQPQPDQLYSVGTIARIMHATQNEDGTLIVLLKGMERFRVDTWQTGDVYLRATVAPAAETIEAGIEIEALQRHLRDTVETVFKLMPQMPADIPKAIRQINDPLKLAYAVAYNINLDLQTRQSLLEMDSAQQKLREMLSHLLREKELLDVQKKIQSEVHQKMSKTQREHFLRQQLEAIKKELGESEQNGSEAEAYDKKIEASDMPDEARKEATRELDRMRHMSPQSAEYPLIKTYLDWLLDLPWGTSSETNADIGLARTILDEDHYGLTEVKQRLIEYLAVRNLMTRRGVSATEDNNARAAGVILCLAGPPGVGKTSLGRSVARAMGREFTRMSLGGVRDEAEIRGHRRTYIGALPGRIIQAIKRAGTRNPVFMLDEIDKLGQRWQGDPASALLEVLDPAQNNTFRDHYLDVDFDLSEVVFIATANQLDTVPGPLRDRMEIIQFDGYTELEKLQIALRHLVPRQLKAHGLRDDEIIFEDKAILKVIESYTREAGVRNLERYIAGICRKGIVQISENELPQLTITSDLVREYLKKERFEADQSETIQMPGIATGLAVTPVGGDILTIEASKMPGKGRLTLTGQPGDVMKESAEIAHSYVRAKADNLGIDQALFDNTDVHLHVPAGALPKDGPSAGVAMVMALASLYGGRTVRSDVGITGEITLRGRVLPVGGVKMKTLAAHRAGLKTVVLPARNQHDLDELPPEVRDAMQFVTAELIDDVFETVLGAPKGG